MKVRQATHADSWYNGDETELDRELSGWLHRVNPAQVPTPPRSGIDVGYVATSQQSKTDAATGADLSMPIQGLKAIIAPHAGYSYSGPCAAWAYKSIDPTMYDRVFILGPSHHVYLDGCALSACDAYATPLGNLPIDKETNEELRRTGKFAKDMTLSTDEDEHSIEMHLPYIRKVFEGRSIHIVPVLVGSISSSKEAAFGHVFAPYLKDERTLFVISSDFCHWGSRFRYTYYKTEPARLARNLGARDSLEKEKVPIHSSIRALDGESIAALTYPSTLPVPDARMYTGSVSSDVSERQTGQKRSAKDAQQAFVAYLRETSNTICGRHPIGVLLGALVTVEEEGTASELRFTRYEQSSRCISPRDSSVSYASAFIRFF